MNTDKGRLADLDRTMKLGESIWVHPVIFGITIRVIGFRFTKIS